MTIELTAQTTFSIQAPAATYEETADLVLLPENVGMGAFRELRYPSNALPPIVYEDQPDRIENFDTAPLTARPLVKSEMGIVDSMVAVWPGYVKDRAVKEVWSGDNTRIRMTAYFFRRLWEYFANPPVAGYITWAPKDRTTAVYNIIIESVSVGGQDTVSLDTLALQQGYILGEVVLTFRIIGEQVS